MSAIRDSSLDIPVDRSIAGFVADTKGQPMTSTSVRVPFLHGFPLGQFANPTELASLELSVDGRRGPERMLDLMLQSGPYGAAFGAGPADGALAKDAA